MNMLLDIAPNGGQMDAAYGEDFEIDKSHKFFLISIIIKEKFLIKKYDYQLISTEILKRNGIFISPDECQKLIKEYKFILCRPNIFSVNLTAMTALLLLYVSGYNFINLVLMFSFLPSIFNFYNNFLIILKLFSFSPGSLIPPIINNEKNFGAVTIIIASRNEPFSVAKMTFDSAMGLHYPANKKQIIVVDNSDAQFEDLTKWRSYVTSCQNNAIDVKFIHRQGTEGYKPRNLDIALQYVSGDHILYMDVDSTLTQDTLLRIMPLFRYDEKLAFIQLQAAPTNAKGQSPLAIAQGIQNYFLRMETILLSHSSHCLFFGHNAIWKTEAIREMGDCLEYHNNEVIVTEDLSMSLRTLFNGYYGCGAWIQSGEWVPESMRETESMWLRWTVGTYQVFAKHTKDIFKLACYKPRDFSGWLQHVISLTNNALTPLYVFSGIILDSTLLMFMAFLSLLPDFTQFIYGSTKFSLDKRPILQKLLISYKGTFILGSYLNWIKFVGFLRFITKQKQGWKPTGKAPEGMITTRQVINKHFPYLLFGIFSFIYSMHNLIFAHANILNSALLLCCGIYGLHCILSVYLFGKARMMEPTEQAIKEGHIDNYSGFYN